MAEKEKTSILLSIKIGLYILGVGGITLFAINWNINNNYKKTKVGDIIGDGNIINLGDTYIGSEEYVVKPKDKRGIKFYPSGKRFAETPVATIGLSVDEVIAKTPICRSSVPECPVQACFASVECQEREDCMKVANVIDHVTKPTPYEIWNVRAKALYLLGYVKNEMLTKGPKVTWETILDAITKAINDDKNLLVRREAIKTFDKLTDFDRKDDFDFGSASKWWCSSDNRKTAIEKLEKTRN